MTLMQDALKFRVLSDLQICPLDVRSPTGRFLVRTHDGRHFEIGTVVRDLLELLRERPLSREQLSMILEERGFPGPAAQAALETIESQLVPNGLVWQSTQVGSNQAGTSYRKRPSFLTVQLPLVGPERLLPITSTLRWAFHPAVVIPALSAVTACHVLFYTGPFRTIPWGLVASPFNALIVLILMAQILAVFHELGHASACRYFSCPHGKIGWGIYLVFFVLYTDVTPTWRLPRNQRLVVDLGGIYFEILCSLVLFALYFDNRNPIWSYPIIAIDLHVLNSLNPFLRRDGYWLATDLLGQTNLRDISLAELRKIFRAGQDKRLVSQSLVSAVAIYSLLSLVFFLALTLWIGYRIIVEIGPAVPSFVRRLIDDLSGLTPNYQDAVETSLRLVLAASFILFALLAGLRMAKAFFVGHRKAGHNDTDRRGHT